MLAVAEGLDWMMFLRAWSFDARGRRRRWQRAVVHGGLRAAAAVERLRGLGGGRSRGSGIVGGIGGMERRRRG